MSARQFTEARRVAALVAKARADALEEAARACEAVAYEYSGGFIADHDVACSTANECASAVRALAEETRTP